MDAVIDWINGHPDWVRFINDTYRNQVVNNILMAVFSIGTFATLIFGITTLVKRRDRPWASLPIFIAFIGFAICMALLMIDRTDLYKSWSVAMA